VKPEVDQSSPWVQGHVVPPEPAPRAGRLMVVDAAPNPREEFEWLIPW
jgi:hypothetical protein